MTTRPANRGVTLQVNVAPSDLPDASETLGHQLRRWSGQVDEVLYTLDLRKSAGPRGAHFDEYKPGMLRLIEDLANSCPRRRLVEVDYSERRSRWWPNNSLEA